MTDRRHRTLPDGVGPGRTLTSNAWIRWSLLFELAITLTLVYVPGINGLFSMEGVPPAWLAILPAGAAAFFLIDHVRRALTSAF